MSELIARTRELSLALRPAMLDDLGLLPTLIWHIDRYQEQTGIQVTLQRQRAGGAAVSCPEVETAAYRIVQEALTNVARHAGVKQAAVQIWIEELAQKVLHQIEQKAQKKVLRRAMHFQSALHLTQPDQRKRTRRCCDIEDHGAGFDARAVCQRRRQRAGRDARAGSAAGRRADDRFGARQRHAAAGGAAGCEKPTQKVQCT